MSIFGFPAKATGGGDFIPILKYDARAGRFFRIDRVDDGAGFVSEPVDITANFKALIDLENLEVGWINFAPGSAPDFCLIKMPHDGSKPMLPGRPSVSHKPGFRAMLKLAKDVGGDKPIREIAGNSNVLLSAIEALYSQFLAGRLKNLGKLPGVVCTKILAVKSGSGERTSTNYAPHFTIQDWHPRGDLVYVPRTILSDKVEQQPGAYTNGQGAPSTGHAAPAQPSASHNLDSDFG